MNWLWASLCFHGCEDPIPEYYFLVDRRRHSHSGPFVGSLAYNTDVSKRHDAAKNILPLRCSGIVLRYVSTVKVEVPYKREVDLLRATLGTHPAIVTENIHRQIL